ncbi:MULTISPECIES: hypothetical protein [unclassified Brenneria]|uniref:hypothetical protein n=1 Tax=unclassified Brenneria TaxID=2634434 RepID=UPI0018F09C1F|nr:hypothetical protein [Brenneria sp. L3-3C-1]MBJ7223527.1 hypothetical protein [Brenneria sp. L3-3C-1]MEE3644768.1 hypothetical protein [Brenneria sp. L3_3C_1]
MNQEPLTLWQAIDQLGQQIPFTPQKVGQALGTSLQVEEQTAARTRWAGGPVTLRGHMRVEQVGLTSRPSATTQSKTVVGLYLGGACITHDQIKAQYGTLQLRSGPRGRSANESAVWESTQPWGQLSFSFRQDNPHCLHSVGITSLEGRVPASAS